MISNTLIKELQVIFREEFRANLKNDEVKDIANSLVNYFDLLLKIKKPSNENIHNA